MKCFVLGTINTPISRRHPEERSDEACLPQAEISLLSPRDGGVFLQPNRFRKERPSTQLVQPLITNHSPLLPFLDVRSPDLLGCAHSLRSPAWVTPAASK